MSWSSGGRYGKGKRGILRADVFSPVDVLGVCLRGVYLKRKYVHRIYNNIVSVLGSRVRKRVQGNCDMVAE